MKRLTINNLSIQVDMPDDANVEEFAKEAIEIINLSLQREPYDLAAQVYKPAKTLTYSVELVDKEDDTEVPDKE